MKKLITVLAVFLSFILFPSFSLGGWKYVGTSIDKDKFYVDYDRIRINNNYVYFWILSDYMKPLSAGFKSSKAYSMGDCELYRLKDLSYAFYNNQMGKGALETSNRESDWIYPIPNSIDDNILKSVCERT